MDGVEGGVFAGEHGGCVGAAAGLHEEVCLGAAGEGGGDFGGGGEAAATVAGDGRGYGIEGEGSRDGWVKMHNVGGWSAGTDRVGGSTWWWVGIAGRKGSSGRYDVGSLHFGKVMAEPGGLKG